MKKQSEKKLSLGKIKVSNLSKTNNQGQELIPSLACGPSYKVACLSQGAPVCSVDSCIF